MRRACIEISVYMISLRLRSLGFVSGSFDIVTLLSLVIYVILNSDKAGLTLELLENFLLLIRSKFI